MAEDKKTKKKADTKPAKKSDKKSDKKAGKKSSKNPFKAIGAFFKSVRSEGKKVVWPKAPEVFKNTIVVLVVIIILGLAIFGIDQALSQGMKGIKKLAEDNTKATSTTAAVTMPDLSDVTTADKEATTAAAEK